MKNLIVITFIVFLTGACSKSTEPTPSSNITTADFSVTIDENPTDAQVLGTINGTSDAGAVTFSISTSSAEGAFSINTNTGELSVADKALFDYEISTAITATVTVADGISTATSNVTVNLNDLSTIWSGAKTTFYKPANADYTLEAFQDRITDNVWITRKNSGTLINFLDDSGTTAPEGVRMAYGTTAQLADLTFSEAMEKLEGTALKDLPGKDVVFFLTKDDIYIDVHFLSWQSMANGGEYSYERSTPN